MRVRCVRILNARGQPAESSRWVRVGEIYVVLCIWVEPGGAKFRLVGDEPTPALFEAEMFEIVTSTIPPNWTIAARTPGCLSLAPQPWNRLGFWEEYFDGKPEAIECFEQERSKIVASEQ